MSTTLIIGGARSGKSQFAEREAGSWRSLNPAGERIYIATASAFDGEMDERIALHKSRRGNDWRTIEEPVALSETLRREMTDDRLILVDCLTLWLSNLLLSDADTDAAIEELCQTLKSSKGTLLLVSNEVGLGIVSENKLARQFRDISGTANQRMGEIASKVVFVAAGLPLVMKEDDSKTHA